MRVLDNHIRKFALNEGVCACEGVDALCILVSGLQQWGVAFDEAQHGIADASRNEVDPRCKGTCIDVGSKCGGNLANDGCEVSRLAYRPREGTCVSFQGLKCL